MEQDFFRFDPDGDDEETVDNADLVGADNGLPLVSPFLSDESEPEETVFEKAPEDEFEDEPDDEPEDEPEDEFEDETDDEPEDEFEDETDDEPEDESDDEFEDEPDDEPEDELEDEFEDETDDEPEDESDDEPEDETDDESEEESDDEPEDESEEESDDETDDEEKEKDEEKEQPAISSDLIRGHINTIILRSLYDGDKYGYEIIAEIERKSHGQYTLKQPSLYSALKRLEKDGYITSYWGGSVSGGRRKYFSLTDDGKAIAERNQTEWEYSRTVIDSLISDKTFDFAQPAPAAVDMRVLKQSTSRVPDRDDFDYDETEFEPEEDLSAQRAAFEAERARFEESLRVREEVLRAREEAGTKREQEILEREFALAEEERRLEEEREAEAEAKAAEEAAKAQAEAEAKAAEEVAKAQAEAEAKAAEEAAKAQAEAEAKAAEEAAKAQAEAEAKAAEEAAKAQAEAATNVLFGRDFPIYGASSIGAEAETLTEEQPSEEEQARRLEEQMRLKEENEAAQRLLEEQQSRLQAEAAEWQKHLAEEQPRLRAEEHGATAEETVFLTEEDRANAMALSREKEEQNARIREMEPFAEERARYEQRLRDQEAELLAMHERELAEQEARIREEDERLYRHREQQIIHQNYLNLVNSGQNEDSAAGSYYYEAPSTAEDYVYVSKPEEEREYRSIIRKLYNGALPQTEAPMPAPAPAPMPMPSPAPAPMPAPAPEPFPGPMKATVEMREEPVPVAPPAPPIAAKADAPARSAPARTHTGRSLDGVDFYDLESLAAQDGIRISTAGGRHKEIEEKSESLVHRGKALFFSALIVFLLCLAEGSIALGFQSQLKLPRFYPYFIWGTGTALLLVTFLMFINHYGERSLRKTGNLLVNVIVAYALCIIVILIVALAAKADFADIGQLTTFVILPAVYFFCIVVFGVAYYLQIRPINEK